MVKKKLRLLELSTRLLYLGGEVEKKRANLRNLVEVQGLPCSSAPVRKALTEFQIANNKWNALEKQYLGLRWEVEKSLCQVFD